MKHVLLLSVSCFFRLFPVKVTGYFADWIGWIFYHSLGFRKEVILDNLKTAFGSEKTDAELNGLVLKNYQHYANVFFEIMRSLSWSKADVVKNIEVLGKENLRPFMDQKKGGFILTSHLGNWEYAILGGSASGVPVDIVVKRVQVAWLENFLQWYRRKTGAGIFHESETAKDILRSINNGRFVCVILDQFMGPPIGLPVKFFGKKAGTAVALALLTEKKDVPVIPAYNFRKEDGKICIVFGPPLNFSNLSQNKTERLYQKTQMFNDITEKYIRKHPHQWFWIHKRWKEYRGEPRWKLSSALFLFLALCLFGTPRCSSTAATPTGIALPSDPSITVPEFGANSSETEDTHSVVSPTETPVIEKTNPVVPSVLPNDAKKKSIKKSSSKKEMKTPPKQESSVNPETTQSAFTIVPVDRIPFEVGEQLVLDLSWTALPAGKAMIEVRNGPDFNGRPTFHLWGNILSSKIVDAVYHVDNTIESFVDRQGMIPYKFLLHMVESKQLKETRVSFDHPNKKSFYWAKRISERWGNQDIDRVDTLTPSAHDMFSALYYARTINYQMGKKVSFAIYENGQNWNVELFPVANELVRSGVGAFQCWKIAVTVKLNNVLSPTGDLFLWLSDDSKKYPVKFDAKIKIGSMHGNLTSIKDR